MLVSNRQRRSRLALRHGLAPDSAFSTPEEVAGALGALHATDPTTVFLSIWARAPAVDRAAIEASLYASRSLVRVMGMRRTLFVVPSTTFPVVEVAVSRHLAEAERRRLAKALAAAGERHPERWIPVVEEKTMAALVAAGEATTADLKAAVPELGRTIVLGSGRWETELAVAARIVFLLATGGRIVRTRPRGTWLSSQWRWAPADEWLGPRPSPAPDEARAALARIYLERFGPATETDVGWWTGWGKRVTRAALASLDLVEVDTEEGKAWALGGDLEDDDPDVAPWVALLPGLDSTVMGWKQRDWYVGEHAAEVFDTAGNGGPSVWVDGRIVGGWAQAPDGGVGYELLEKVAPAAEAAIADRAARLTDWLGGPIMPRFPSPLHKRLAAALSASG